MDELKPCPFCGGKAASFSEYTSEKYEGKNIWRAWVGCSDPYCPMGIGFEVSGEGDSWCDGSGYDKYNNPAPKLKAKAEKLWNRRAASENKAKGECVMDAESKRIFDALYDLHDRYDEDPKHMICAEAADYIKSLSEMLSHSIAAPENKPLTLPHVSDLDRQSIYDFLHDCFADWVNDPKVGLIGMNEGESALANAIMEALKDEPKNDNSPLPLEQLKQMDGEPVWCELLKEYGIVCLDVEWPDKESIWFPKGAHAISELMQGGIYAHKPEGSEPNG